MLDFEKLGAFYLGKRVDAEAGAVTDELVLYDSKDLTTHAVIIGMTGSGKTGLGIDLIEEAALDHVPVIAIDPKGDIGNLLLTFPGLEPAAFRPWINERQATDRGVTADAFAEEQAALWKRGLAAWGQDGARIARLRDSAETVIYTPGSNAGRPISLLQSFAAPTAELRDDGDLYRERIRSTATGLLSLVDVEADPLTSREHILLSQIFDQAWRAGGDLDLAALIAAVQDPPIDKVGVMSLDTFYPAKERFELAMRLNNLLAAPGFEAWMRGEPLDAARLLHAESGKPRVSVVSIAHLGDAERMFFVSMLLNEVIAWMRAQAGTSSLRAILYMDELAGYMPPVANPPSKPLFLTLLKQARAYGLGLVLATQNPVDLDYKGLANAGTWFLGRLQTERDKARVMEGLEGARQGAAFDRQAVERTLAGLGKRRFLLHNVHEDEPVVFETRWAMSYLAGPLTREQIRKLAEAAPARQAVAPASEAVPAARVATPVTAAGAPPLLPPSVRQYWLEADGGSLVYRARLVASVDMLFANATHDVHEERRFVYTADFGENGRAPDWNEGRKAGFGADALTDRGPAGASCVECPAAAADAAAYAKWQKQLAQWLRRNETVRLMKSARFRLTSKPASLEDEIGALDTAYDAQAEELTEISVRAKAADVHIPLFGPCGHRPGRSPPRGSGSLPTRQEQLWRSGQMKRAEQLLLRAGALLGVAVFASASGGAAEGTQPGSQDINSQGSTSKAQITVLYDAFGRDTSMQKDWGFSALIEVGGKRILFDTGNNSGILAHNVKAKGVDVTRLDFVVMSHRHGDHMGGLNYLLSVNPNVPIYAPKENFGVFGASLPGTFYRRNESLPPDMRYFNGNPPETLYFGTPWPQGNFTWLSETTEVAPGFHLIVLKGTWGVDLDVMEISLAIDTPNGIVLVVGCGHPTIEKVVEAATTTIDRPIHLVIGGLHLLPADDDEIQRIATVLRDTWSVEWLAPVHCTGEFAFEILKETFGDRYLYAGLGTALALDRNRSRRAARTTAK